MNFPGKWRLQRILKSVSPGCVVLYYHRITSIEPDSQQLCVDQEMFRNHLQALKRRYTILPLSEVVQMVSSRSSFKGRCAAITFDDGYADNFHNALPVLEEMNVPATFFVSSGYIGARREFWWDHLERVLRCDQRLPERLSVKIGLDMMGWNTRSVEERTDAYLALLEILKSTSGETRNSILDEISEWAEMSVVPRQSHAPLSEQELKSLDGSELAEIGGHTVWHSCLSRLPQGDQAREIKECKVSIEDILGHDVRLFSFPFGQRRDYDQSSLARVREAGFDAALIATEKVLRHANVFQIPRLGVKAMSSAELCRIIDDAWRF